MSGFSRGLIAVGLVALAGQAQARSGDCSMPAALAERVCAVPELRKLDAELVARERAALAVTARPATWTARAAQFRAWIAQEKDFEDRPIGAEALRSHLESQIQQLDNEIARARNLPTGAGREAILGDKCFGGWLSMACTVPQAGVVRDGAVTILWRIETGASEVDGIGAGILLWDASGPGAPRLIGWTYEGVDMKSPQLNAERGLLLAPGRRMGTGEGNADMLFQKRGDRWVEIGMESWRDALGKRLPDGVDSWKGVDYYFLGDAIGADTELWKPSDANCCATAGRANLGFRIEGEQLQLDTISAQLGGPDKEWKDF
jgi:hypothetical protein